MPRSLRSRHVLATGVPLGHRRVVDPVRRGGAGVGLVGLGARRQGAPSKAGSDFGTRYREDFAIYASLGLTHHRLSIEWARVEPEPGRHDGAAIEHYRDEDAPRSPLGYAIWADGLSHVLRRLHEMVHGTPLLVAEYGIGTDDDEQRAEYLRRGLEITARAIADGIDVRGFFHWTVVDNYEWLHGFEVAFGIVDRDRDIRPSAQVLATVARDG